MYTSILLIATTLGYVTATPAPQSNFVQTGPVFLGSPCSTTSQCPGGSQCYAVNSMLQPTCGGFQASCTTDAQCATNSCASGFCNGPVAPTLPLGTPCYEDAQCVNGAVCYAVNSMEYPLCGNFAAPCASNGQCLFGSCVGGQCAGPSLSTSTSSSSLTSIATASPTSVPTISPTSVPPTTTTSPTSVPTTSLTSVPTTGPTLSATTTTMTTMTVTPMGTGGCTSSMAGNSTVQTATHSPLPVFTGGANERLSAGLGGAVIASAAMFALMIVV